MKLLIAVFLNLIVVTITAQSNARNITWILTKIEDKQENTTLTLSHEYSFLRFNDSTYSGYGCNAFSGKYKITGNKIFFLGGMHVSDNICSLPEDYIAKGYIMKDFTQLTYKQTADTLILSKDDVIVFTYHQKKKK